MQPYMVLARKFRPKDFDEVIGQEHISKVLKNAISENKIAHAYIFSGPRGVGKTTTARIFAKALNCKEGPIPHPCGVCSNCLEISKGISIDVLEMDGASNTGIEHARTLIENVKFVPSSSKYKIYIIDEAHRISTAAFDALLKTIEEPPEHIVFILATTEQHKIPATIFSRCQSFRFKLVSSKEISQRIKEIAEQENFEIDEEAIGIITAASGGSVRDALSLLDQAVSSSSSKLTGEYVRELLGLLPKDIIVSMTDYIAEGNAAKILKIIDDVSSEGYNILELAKNLRDYLRELMIYSINPKTKEMLGSDKIFFEKQKDLFSIQRHIRMNNLISKALDDMKWNDQPRTVFEMYALKMSEPYYNVGELINKAEEIEKEFKAGGAARSFSRNSDGERYAPKEEKANDSVVSDIDLIDIWEEIAGEICRQEGHKADRLLKGSIKIISPQSVSICAPGSFVFDGISKYASRISKLFKQKTGMDIDVKVEIDESMGKTSSSSSIAAEESVAAKVDREIEEPQAGIEVKEDLKASAENSYPSNIEEIAKTFGGTIRKADK